MNKKFIPDRYLLLSLLSGIHLSAAPIYSSVPVSIILFIIFLSLWQLFIIYYHKYSPGKLLQISTILLSFSLVIYSYGHLFGQNPGIALVILMTLMKLFEIKSQRDCYIIIYSSIFIIASNFFNTQSVWLIIYVFITVLYLLTILIALSDRLNSLPIKLRLKMSARFIVYATPFMLILFVLFPRIPGPLWALPDDAMSNRTGLSEEMSPGSIKQLISSSQIAFRVKFDSAIPEHKQRYWRGVALSVYDGKTWRRSDAPEQTEPNIRSIDKNNIARYTITLEPTNLNWLLTLEYPVIHDSRYRLSREATLLSSNKINNVINYTITSELSAQNQSLFPQEDYKNRLLPINLNPRTMKLATQFLQASNFDTVTYINTVLSYFHNNKFFYTLSPNLLGQNAMDDFLFDSQKGFCEHYASAFVYLMRAAGIPSRVVIGYQGGKMNPFGDYMIVRQSDAHAWAEVWISNHWTRIDPTAAVSPERIEKGIQNAGLNKDKLPFLLVSNNSFLKNAAFLYDRFQNNWNQWVIGFNQEKQNNLLKTLGIKNTSTANLILLLVGCLTISALFIFWLVLRHTSSNNNRIQYYYNVFCHKLERYNIARQLHEGPVDFENRVYQKTDLSDISKQEIHFIFKAYRTLHYGNRINSNLLARYIKKVKSFKVRKKN